MDDIRLRTIPEATYLTTDNAWRYRAILHYFYVEHEKMRQYLFPEDIYSYLQENPYFREYTEEQLHSDLKQLVEWKNLIPRQETGRVMTIDDFKRKKFRYQCTPYTIEIERMVKKLQELGESFGGSLEATLFDRLLQALRYFDLAADKDSGSELNQAWDDLYTYFKKIGQNASDYIAYLKSEKVEERMMTQAFLIYKDAFASYLREFMLGLQHASYNIEALLKGMTAERFAMTAEKIADYQMNIPRLDDRGDHGQLVERYHDQWRSLNEWFLGGVGRQSELSSLENETTDTIRRITRFAQRLGERQQNARSRYRDYLHLAGWFRRITETKEAHELSGLLFGLAHTRHIYAQIPDSEDMYREVWDDAPTIFVVKPRVNTYREKTKPGAVISRTEEKQAMRQLYIKEKEQQQQLINSIIMDGCIIIAELPVQHPFIRKTLLNWIGKCMASAELTGKTETGQKIRLIKRSDEMITLQCQDGDLIMPDFAIEVFLNEGSGYHGE